MTIPSITIDDKPVSNSVSENISKHVSKPEPEVLTHCNSRKLNVNSRIIPCRLRLVNSICPHNERHL